MTRNIYIYILCAAAVSYAIRALPLTLIRRPITSPFLQSFLYYVPYVTLAVMTFPAMIQSCSSPIAGIIAFAAGVLAAYKGKSLMSVACISCLCVFLAELLL